MAPATDLPSGSAAAARVALRRREISARELTALVLDRIDAVNPALTAVVELRAEAALAEAAAADRLSAAGTAELPVLHGYGRESSS